MGAFKIKYMKYLAQFLEYCRHVLHGCYMAVLMKFIIIIIKIKFPFIEDAYLCIPMFICIISFNLYFI